jgi:MtN3 and saliva related transmembrane protein
MESFYINIVGLIAASLTTVSFLPQTLKTIKTKDTSGISLLMYLLFTIGVLFWSIFGILIKTYVIVGANLVTLTLAAIILFIKVKNVLNGTDK